MKNIDMIFAKTDRSNDKKISYDEWKKGFEYLKADATEEQMKFAFEQADTDHTGSIDIKELKARL